MKKLLSLFGVLILFGTTVLASGKNSSAFTPSGVALVKNGAVIKVVYKSAQHATVKISIENENGKIFFSEFITSKDGFVRPYNLSRLPSGNYTVKVSDKSGIHSEVITMEGKEEIVYYVRQLKNEPSKYLLTIPAASSDLVLVLVYEDGKVIHKEEVALQGDYAKLYNVKFPEREIFIDVKAIH
jgi:flagellar hook assembly protein FlgD